MIGMKNCHNNKYDNSQLHCIPQKQPTYLQACNSCLEPFTKYTTRIWLQLERQSFHYLRCSDIKALTTTSTSTLTGSWACRSFLCWQAVVSFSRCNNLLMTRKEAVQRWWEVICGCRFFPLAHVWLSERKSHDLMQLNVANYQDLLTGHTL